MFGLDKNVKSLDTELNDMILKGELIPAFEKYYDENIVMQENAAPPLIGKEANHLNEEQFVSFIQKVDACELLSQCVNGDTSFTEWHMDVTFKNGERHDLHQVAVRHWKDGKVVHERFYHA